MKKQTASTEVVGGDKKERTDSSKSGKSHKKLPILLIVVVLVLLGLWFMHQSNNKNAKGSEHQTQKIVTKGKTDYEIASQYIKQNNKAKALEYAKKAMDKYPDNTDIITMVAALTKDKDPAEAKRLYSHELDLLKKQTNVDAGGKSPAIYWSVAVQAEEAGQKDQAIKYYQEAIKAANPTDVNQQSVADESQKAISRLQ